MSGPDPAVARTRTAVGAVLDPLPDDALVLVACSGGPDSLALAAAVAFVAARSPLRAGAVVVDHGLQDGSAEVAGRAAAACAALGLDPVHVESVEVTAVGGPEAAARSARYAALERVARRTGAAAVLLGHTLDDQAETVLLGLARGSGARSLAGMPASRGLLVRPFLGLRRSDTVGACRAQGLEPWSDPTNDATDGPLRSQVRGRVMPVLEEVLGPGVAQALARTADQLRADAEVLDALAGELVSGARRDGADAEAHDAHDDTHDEGAAHDLPRVSLDVAALLAAPDAVRRRALHAACRAAGVPAGALSAAHVAAIDALLTHWHGQGPVHLPGGGRAQRSCGRLTLRAGAGATTTSDGEH